MAAVAPQPYVLVQGDAEAPGGLDEPDTIAQCLSWIGFVDNAHQNRIIL